MHAQLVPLIARITQQTIMASYSYLAAYQPGAILKRHRDRPQCVWNMSLAVDCVPESDSA
jgi:hypothetical protein